ncbi:MAG TPA: hypothetical protein VHD69_01235 [Candidatus Paceibacterota bacterium]|jgi:hypothetical protein|nr:hypothetical protein [Candidatus Paceibacterota bacterium]
MKKIIYVAVVLSLLVPALAFAQSGGGNSPVTGAGSSPVTSGGNSPVTSGGNSTNGVATMNYIPNPLEGVNSISDLIYKIVKVVVDLSYVVIAFFLLLSGFKFVTAQGNDKKLDEAKSTFFYTIIGAALVIGSQVIVSIIQGIFKGLNS